MNIYGFGDEAIAAFVVFILGIIFTLLWQGFTEKKHRLVYKVSVDELKLSSADEYIKDRLSLHFDSEPVDSLYAYNIALENVGNQAIRDQQLLFEFDSEAVSISKPRIQHDPLVGPVQQISEDLTPYRITYKIGLLAVGQQVNIRLFTKNNQSSQMKVYGRNKTDLDTQVLEQSSQRLLTLRDHAQRLLILGITYLVVPPLIDFLVVFSLVPFQVDFDEFSSYDKLKAN